MVEKSNVKVEESLYKADLIAKQVEAMEENVRRHETVCCELALKFDQ
jgi:hypothetical protein